MRDKCSGRYILDFDAKNGRFLVMEATIFGKYARPCCASTAVRFSPDTPRSGRIFIGSACPTGLAFMGLTGELRPRHLSTSALEQPAWALV